MRSLFFISIIINLLISIPSNLFAEAYGEEPIPVGIVVPLSGAQSLVGEALKNGLFRVLSG